MISIKEGKKNKKYYLQMISNPIRRWEMKNMMLVGKDVE